MDGQTLANIWAGNIISWDDEAIRSLNPSIASKLPNATIKLAFYSGPPLGMLGVITSALCSISKDPFEKEFNKAGQKMAYMKPALAGNAIGFPDEQLKFSWAQVPPFKRSTESPNLTTLCLTIRKQHFQ